MVLKSILFTIYFALQILDHKDGRKNIHLKKFLKIFTGKLLIDNIKDDFHHFHCDTLIRISVGGFRS
jgi:hypothetical protein